MRPYVRNTLTQQSAVIKPFPLRPSAWPCYSHHKSSMLSISLYIDLVSLIKYVRTIKINYHCSTMFITQKCQLAQTIFLKHYYSHQIQLSKFLQLCTMVCFLIPNPTLILERNGNKLTVS